MWSFPTLQQAVNLATILLTLLVLVKALSISRREPLRSFAFLMGAYLTAHIVMSQIPFHTTRYGRAYMAFEILFWILQLRVVLKIYQSVLAAYPGIATISAWAVIACFAIALAAGIAFLVLQPAAPGKFRSLALFFPAMMLISGTFAIFLILMNLFLAWYPLPINRNTTIHTIALGTYFIISTAGIWLHVQTKYKSAAQIGLGLEILELGTYLLWFFGLTRAGEIPVHEPQSCPPGLEEDALFGRFKALDHLIVDTIQKNR